jgi:Rhodopirellula transposase DDE domain
MLKFIRTTKTTTGLRVRATLMTGHYPKGIKPTPKDMASLNLMPHTTLPQWNYTLPSTRRM